MLYFRNVQGNTKDFRFSAGTYFTYQTVGVHTLVSTGHQKHKS